MDGTEEEQWRIQTELLLVPCGRLYIWPNPKNDTAPAEGTQDRPARATCDKFWGYISTPCPSPPLQVLQSGFWITYFKPGRAPAPQYQLACPGEGELRACVV